VAIGRVYLAAESAAEIDPAAADLGQGSVVAIGLVLAVMGPVRVDLGSELEIVPESADPGLATIVPESVDPGSAGAIGRGLATIGPESVAEIDPGLADLGLVVAIARAYLAVTGLDYLAIARDSRAETGPSPAAGHGQEPAAAACSGLVVPIGLDGLAIDRESQAGMVASAAATGPDGLAIVPESVPAISVPVISVQAISDMSAITLVLSTGPITAGTLTTTSEVAGEVAGVAATGG
jgi:hypothetical protein